VLLDCTDAILLYYSHCTKPLCTASKAGKTASLTLDLHQPLPPSRSLQRLAPSRTRGGDVGAPVGLGHHRHHRDPAGGAHRLGLQLGEEGGAVLLGDWWGVKSGWVGGNRAVVAFIGVGGVRVCWSELLVLRRHGSSDKAHTNTILMASRIFRDPGPSEIGSDR